MNEKKEALRSKFSADYKRYYLVDLFKREGFLRKKCASCGRYFWTLDGARTVCEDQPCSPYSFIGAPPTSRKFDRVGAWKAIERFFVKNGHTSVKRYPVVSRWRPDLYFTVASIIDFQRVEGGKVVFQLPANPLVVPQVCLRFNDIPNVGVSGRHGTSFVMVGQHSIADREGYWKDRCIDLDFKLMTKEFGIGKDEITFNEEVWVGYGAFGYSLEYCVRGLELGNAVFTAFEGEVGSYRQMKERVVDMGAGLERWSWLSQGTPTSYDAGFGDVLRRMNDVCKTNVDEKLFLEYSKLAGRMNAEESGSLAAQRSVIAKALGVDSQKLEADLAPLEAVYAIADHAQSLLFGIADGMLPSNSGGGYNLRILFRRAMNFINYYRFPLSITDVVNWQIDSLRGMYPELEEHRHDVAQVLEVEGSRYASSTERVSKIVSSIAAAGRPTTTTDDLIRLYDSDGVTPEQLIEAGAKVSMPEDFYEKVQARHSTRKLEEEKPKFDVGRLPPTKLVYYDDDAEFNLKAKVLKVFPGGYVILDRTVFYPRGGGQEPDKGTIGEARVVDVEKYGDVVIHKIEGKPPKAGSKTECHVDGRRRRRIMQIHTATHILNGSSRQILGPWVWQHSAFKEEDYGRIDITHFSHLTEEEVMKIEDLANEVIRRNLKVRTSLMPRQKAEEKYGFRLYQGGVVPTKLLRVVDIGGWDIEACGGTHTRTTGEVGMIKITKAERIQDGVERLEFVAGEAAVEYMHRMDSELQELVNTSGYQRETLAKGVGNLVEELSTARARIKALEEQLATGGAQQHQIREVLPGVRLQVGTDSSLSGEGIILRGQDAVRSDPSLFFVNVAQMPTSVRITAFSGSNAVAGGVRADEVVRQLAEIVGGSGGGSPSFAQGGGPRVQQADAAVKAVEEIVRKLQQGKRL